MPAVVTHTAILLLTRARLVQLRDTMDTRLRAYPKGAKPLVMEQRLRDLAAQAIDFLAAPPLAPADLLGGTALGGGISRLAVMGAMGPDIPGFSNALQPGQAWLFDSVHKGSPDAQRERIIARTTDLALEIWNQARIRVRADVPAAKQAVPLARVRAYVLGHLCHLAGDIVSHPFINDLEWHDGTDVQTKMDHAEGEAAHDAAVAQQIFGRGSLRDGPDWADAYPDPDKDVPEQLFAAYADALETVLGARTNRPKGLGRFEAIQKKLDTPAPDADFLRDGYSLLKRGIVRHVYDRGAPGWALLLAPAMLPVIALPFLTLALPGLRFLGLADNSVDTERQVFEMLTHALYPASLSAVIYQSLFLDVTRRGVDARQWASLVQTILNLVAAVFFYVESGRQDWSAGARWGFLFALPMAVNGIFATLSIADFARKEEGGHHHRRRMAATLLPPLFSIGMLVAWGAFLVLFVEILAITGLVSGITDLAGGDGFNPVTPAFWIAAGLWFILGIVLWVWLSQYLRDVKIKELPDNFAAARRHVVRLFDEDTLYADPLPDNLIDGTGPEMTFPSGRRALARLWWTGTGTMSIRSDRYGLVFRLRVNNVDRPDQVFPAPVAPMRLAEYLTFLSANVQNANGTAGDLATRALDPKEDYDLPAGAVFAAHGDTASTASGVVLGATEFLPLGGEDNDKTYVLHHAPKVWQSIRFGPIGPVARPTPDQAGELGEVEPGNGYTYVHDHTSAVAAGRVDSSALMSLAGDLGALFCLGAVPHLAGQDDQRIFQVFRNWNLDRRRVNEWRMLVAGRARSEKTAPDRYEPAMPRGALGPAKPDDWRAPIGAGPAREAEDTALAEGWIPAFRKWMAIMAAPAQDPNATGAFQAGDPTNRALSRAVAWMLDLPEPATRAT